MPRWRCSKNKSRSGRQLPSRPEVSKEFCVPFILPFFDDDIRTLYTPVITCPYPAAVLTVLTSYVNDSSFFRFFPPNSIIARYVTAHVPSFVLGTVFMYHAQAGLQSALQFASPDAILASMKSGQNGRRGLTISVISAHLLRTVCAGRNQSPIASPQGQGWSCP